MQKIKLSVVIPAYNEAKNISGGALNKVYEYLSVQNYAYEVIIVDDGSIDDTVKIIEKLISDMPEFRLIKNPHGGKAITVITGLLECRGEIALFTDMDQATPIEEVEKFFPKFEQGYDIVIGIRTGRKGAPLFRKFSAWGFSMLRNIILGLPFTDTQCGFKAFNRSSLDGIFPSLLKIWRTRKTSGAAVNAGFDVEALYLAKQKGFKITEAGVNWHYVGSERVPFFSSAIEATRDMLRIRTNDLQGKYI